MDRANRADSKGAVSNSGMLRRPPHTPQIPMKGITMTTKLVFSRHWPDHAGRIYPNDADARLARDMAYEIVLKHGHTAKRETLSISRKAGSPRAYLLTIEH
jgi:hypothetical protein